MSAANAKAASTSLAEQMRAHEPSMEEILASIRRIIADDDGAPPARQQRARADEPLFEEEGPAPAPQDHACPAPALEPAREPAPVAEIRQLRVNRAVPQPEVVPQEAEEAFVDEDDEDLAVALEAVAEEAESFEADELGAPLVSTDAASSVASHFEALAATMLINDSGLLQKYAQEMMRPLLKQWLDDNLPVIVERLVRAEIERVARGGRR
jgi:uncharacterized protein